MEGAERDLRGVEELAALGGGNGFDEDGVGQASDEVADVFVSGKWRHGVAVRLAGLLGGEVLVRASATLILHVGVVGAPPGGAATLERLGVRGLGVEARGRRRLRCWGGFDQAEFGIGCFGHSWILPVDSVRGSRVIFCNGLAVGFDGNWGGEMGAG